MTQEEKQLLLKCLCAMLPHKVRCKCVNGLGGGKTDHGVLKFIGNCNGVISNYYEDIPIDSGFVNNVFYPIENIKPYLRPISSMTEEEVDKLFDILNINKEGNDEDWIKINDVTGIKFFFPTGKWIENVAEVYDYLNSIHVDYRGFIEKGLALEAPKEMYK